MEDDRKIVAQTNLTSDFTDKGGLNIELVTNKVNYGEKLDLEITGNIENGEISYRIISGEDKVQLDENTLTATEVGEAIIEVTVTETENYERVIKEFTIAVQARPAYLYWRYPRFFYNSEEQVPIAEVINLVGGDECTVTVSGSANAGVGIIARAIALSNSNYTLTGGHSLRTTYTISPLQVMLEWGDLNLVYTGKEQTPEVEITNIFPGDTCEIMVSGAATNVGEYTAQAYELSNKNYTLNGVVNSSAGYTIETADIELNVSPSIIIYGVSTEIELEGNIGNGEVTYSVINNSGRAEMSDGKITGTQVGRIFLRVEVAATKNTNAGNTLAEIWVKIGLDLSFKFEEIQYGDTVPLEIDGNLGGGEVSYALELLPDDSGMAELDGNLLTGTNVGTVRVIADVSATGDYDSGRVEQLIIVLPRIAEFDWDSLELVYNGEEQKPSATVRKVNEDDECFVEVTGARTDPGTYTAEAVALLKADGSDCENYTLVGADTTVVFKIVIEYTSGSATYDYLTEMVVAVNNINQRYRVSYGTLDWKHGVDDTELEHDFVLGNIPVKTSIDTFLNNMFPKALTEIRLYNSTGDLVYNCGEYEDGFEGYRFVGTGWYLLIGKDVGTAEKLRLSVLGDVTGDGIITRADSEMLADVVRGLSEFTEIEFRLASYIVNISETTAADFATVNTILLGLAIIEDFFDY